MDAKAARAAADNSAAKRLRCRLASLLAHSCPLRRKIADELEPIYRAILKIANEGGYWCRVGSPYGISAEAQKELRDKGYTVKKHTECRDDDRYYTIEW